MLLVVSACQSGEASSDGESPSTPPSSEAPIPGTDPHPMGCSSIEDLDKIVDLLRSGQPTYDYQPAADLAELVSWADLAVTGSIDAAVRAGRGDDSYLAVSVSDVEVLAGAGDVSEFGSMAFWASGQGPDPLLDTATFERLRFVAMLDRFPEAPGGYAPLVEGLVLGCEDDAIPVRSLAEPPPHADDHSLSELADLIKAAAAGTQGVTASAVDGPVIRHPRRTDSEEGLAAEVRGVLQLEADCLYVLLDERYPIVWPASTTWDEANEKVVLATGVSVGIGESVYGGGGYFFVDDVRRLAGDEAAQRAAKCEDNEYGEIAIVNNDDEAIDAD